MAALSAACGGGPAPKTPETADEHASASQTDQEQSASGADWGSTDATPAASCYEKCGELIRRADGLYAQAETRGNGPSRSGAFKRAGDAYVLAWRGCSLSLPNGEDLGCEGAKQVVSRMVTAFGQGEDDSQRVFSLLVAHDRRWRADGAASADASELRSIAERGETKAKSAKDKATIDGLAAATYARIAAGDSAEAARDLALFGKLARKDAPEEFAMLTIALASYLNDAGTHQQALGVLGSPPSNQPARVSILWHSEQGRAQAGLKRDAAAQRSFSSVIQTWNGMPKDKGLAQQLGRAMPWPMQGRERVVEAVGAAHFHAGEVLRARAQSMPFPRYKGPKSMEGASAFLNESVGAYVRDRQKLQLEADAAYNRVSEIKPVPPPRYLVASAASIGEMWASLADDVIRSPLPPYIAEEEDLANGYRRSLEESMKPIQDKARRAFTICRDTAREVRLEDDQAAKCARWLSDHSN